MPVEEMFVVVHLVFLFSKGFHLTLYLRILEHQIHADCKIALVLALPYDVERILHDAPDNVPLLFRFDVGLHPESQYFLQLIRIDPMGEERVALMVFVVSLADFLGQHAVLSLVHEKPLKVFFAKRVLTQFVFFKIRMSRILWIMSLALKQDWTRMQERIEADTLWKIR